MSAMSEVKRPPRLPIKAVSVDQAAKMLGIGRTSTFVLVGSGSLRSLKIGSRRLVPISAIEEFLERESHPMGESP